MKDIAIYGAGGFGREVACLIRNINKEKQVWNLIGFFDDGKDISYSTEYGSVLGGIDELNKFTQPLDIVVAIGNPKTVENVISSINNPLIGFPNVISPDVTFLDANNFSMEKGNIICSHCWISCNVHIGSFNTMNVGVTVGHDSIIGNYNSFMPAVKISGAVCIGDHNFFGVSSCVLQQIKIGQNTIVGANSLIIRSTKDEGTYLGNPAVKITY
ncbi:NeuD/PglB/VioB family sugar acetyltransferase [Parabacteroides pacaensis]|uniref:NeuD/PglB/VioB family sugar acetyltransferase n=1 Tax=Parabacteroides pacaensis TaxID=2086575 RepID=UPI000D107A34|nr:NeuD/PglB/VioB family sugar acetyltransferase [Parabacteroides pacaensis]